MLSLASQYGQQQPQPPLVDYSTWLSNNENRRRPTSLSSSRGQVLAVGILGAIFWLALLVAYGIMQVPDLRREVGADMIKILKLRLLY